MSVRSSISERHERGRRLRAIAAAIGARSIEAMYADPFWAARFGERGRAFADDDGRRHVQFLSEAVETARPEPFETYARWLQGVLTTRGMCTLHIHDNFVRLEDALKTEAPELAAAAAAILAAARSALRPASADIAALYDAAVEMPRPPVSQPCVEHPAFLVSYLCDALQFERDGTFLTHAEWLWTYAAGLGDHHVHALEATLRQVRALVERQPSAAHTTRARALLERAASPPEGQRT